MFKPIGDAFEGLPFFKKPEKKAERKESHIGTQATISPSTAEVKETKELAKGRFSDVRQSEGEKEFQASTD